MLQLDKESDGRIDLIIMLLSLWVGVIGLNFYLCFTTAQFQFSFHETILLLTANINDGRPYISV